MIIETAAERAARVRAIVAQIAPEQRWSTADGRVSVEGMHGDYVVVADLAAGERRHVHPTDFGTVYRRRWPPDPVLPEGYGYLTAPIDAVRRGSCTVHAAELVWVRGRATVEGFWYPASLALCGTRGWGEAGADQGVTCHRCRLAVQQVEADQHGYRRGATYRWCRTCRNMGRRVCVEHSAWANGYWPGAELHRELEEAGRAPAL